METFNIVVLSSSSGGNFQSVVEKADIYGYTVLKLITNKECLAIDKAIKLNIPHQIINSKGNQLFIDIYNAIPVNTDLIVLAGFMPIIPDWFCKQWQNRIINTHPSLLPAYGGKGMYGVKVQEAVMAAHELYAGCTVHYVDSTIDGGAIIEQRSIPVDYSLTPWELGGEIFKLEMELLPYVIGKICIKEL